MADIVLSLVLQLGWREIIVVTEDGHSTGSSSLVQNLSKHGVQHVLVSGDEALSGQWLHRLVRTGEDSWRPLNIVLLCSLPCIQSAQQHASELELQYGTLSAFAMSSRWLLIPTVGDDLQLIPTRGDNLLDRLHLQNVTMDNVALVDQGIATKVCNSHHHFVLHTLMRTRQGRAWRPVNNVVTDSNSYNCGHCQSSTCSSSDDLGKLLFPNFSRGFHGRHIRVLAKGFTAALLSDTVNGRKTWTGVLADLLHVLSHTVNLTYDIVEPTEDVWGSGTAADADTGFYGHVIRHEVDLGLAPTELLPDRLKLMDFTHPVFYTSIVMVYRKQETRDLNMALVPFSNSVLVAIMGCLVTVTLCIVGVELNAVFSNSNNNNKASQTYKRSLLDRFWTFLSALDGGFQITAAALLSEPSEVPLRSRSGKVLLMSWWMFSLVMAAAYSSTLTAFLSVIKDRQLFSRLEDLVSKQHDYTWGTYGRSGLALTLQTSNVSMYRDLWAGIQRFTIRDPDVLSEDIGTLADKVCREKFVLLFYQLAASSMFPDDCHVTFVDVAMRQSLSSLVLPKGSALTQRVSDVIRALHSAGILSHWTTKWFPRVTRPSPPDPKVISLQHVQGVMLVVPVGVGLALMVLMVELLYDRRKQSGSATCEEENR